MTEEEKEPFIIQYNEANNLFKNEMKKYQEGLKEKASSVEPIGRALFDSEFDPGDNFALGQPVTEELMNTIEDTANQTNGSGKETNQCSTAGPVLQLRDKGVGLKGSSTDISCLPLPHMGNRGLLKDVSFLLDGRFSALGTAGLDHGCLKEAIEAFDGKVLTRWSAKIG